MKQDQARITTVPGQYLGYSLQSSRMLDYLLSSGGPGRAVSLEVLGDVAISSEGSNLVEEIKSRTSGHNPVSDRSVELWKTFRNWIEAVQVRALDPATTQFNLFVTRSFSAPVATRLSDASSLSEARILISELHALFLAGKDPVSRDSELGEHLAVVFGADQDVFAGLICNFKLEFGTGRSWDELRNAIEGALIPPDSVDGVLRELSGWLKQQIDTNIEAGFPAIVLWEDFRNAAVTAVRHYDRRTLFTVASRTVSKEEIEAELGVRTYVRQLDIIGVDDEDKTNAVADYLLASAARVEWAQRGYVLEDSFDSFELELTRAWKNYKDRIETAFSSRAELDRGQLVFRDCCEHRSKLDQSDPPDHFCRGSFHKLSDALAVGWHPRFKELLPSTAQNGADDAR